MQMALQVVQEIALYAILLLFFLIGMCTKLVYFVIFALANQTIMEVISSRDFRAQMGEYMRKALSSDVIIKSRSHGSFKLVPVSEDDTLMSKEAFFAKIDRALQSIEEGHFHTMMPGESVEDFMDRMETEGNV